MRYQPDSPEDTLITARAWYQRSGEYLGKKRRQCQERAAEECRKAADRARAAGDDDLAEFAEQCAAVCEEVTP